MTDQNDAVLETEVATPTEKVEETAKPEIENQGAAKAEDAKDDTAKDEAKASEAAKTLNEHKAKKADRFRQIDWERHENLRRAEAAERRLAEYEKIQRPDPSKFEDISEYDAATAKYAATLIRKDDLAFEATTQREEALHVQQRLYREALGEFQQDNPTFNPNDFIVAAQGQRYADNLGEAIMDDPHMGIPIMAALLKNPAEIARIASLPPKAQLKELIRIELNLSQPVPKKITKAPEPISSVRGSGSPTKEADFDKMSFKEYKAYREAGGK